MAWDQVIWGTAFSPVTSSHHIRCSRKAVLKILPSKECHLEGSRKRTFSGVYPLKYHYPQILTLMGFRKALKTTVLSSRSRLFIMNILLWKCWMWCSDGLCCWLRLVFVIIWFINGFYVCIFNLVVFNCEPPRFTQVRWVYKSNQ